MWPNNAWNDRSGEPGWFDNSRNASRVQTNIYEPVLTETGTEPVTLVQAKAQCRVDFTDDDTLITSLLTQCRRVIEQYTSRSLINKTVSLPLDLLTPVELPYGPVLASPAPILTDNQGNTVDPTTYFLRGVQFPRLVPNGQWYYGATLAYSTGYGTGAPEPDLCLAILHEIAFRYELRGDAVDTRKGVNPGISESARALAAPYIRSAWV